MARRLRGNLEDAGSNGYYCSDSETVRYICDILRLRCSRCPHPWAGLEVLADLIEPQPITGDTSDGYHTFNELYDHRAKLFSVIVQCFKDRAWKSKLHHDGTMYEGMFVVGIETPLGQATYHYDIDPYWNAFDCQELIRAPEWDGHIPEQAISRIASLRPSCDRDALLALACEMKRMPQCELCSAEIVDCSAHPDGCPDALLDYYSRRIRKALGVCCEK